jgi:hypothetical protein
MTVNVSIDYDSPPEPNWLCSDNIEIALSSYCKNTKFHVTSLPFLSIDQISELVYFALGQASMCWKETPRGVFDSTRCAAIGSELVKILTGKESSFDRCTAYNNKPAPTKASS